MQVGISNGATKCTGSNGHSPAYSTQTHNANSHTAETPGQWDGARLWEQRPLTFSYKTVASADVSASRNQEANGQISDIFCESAKGGSDRQTSAAAVGQIDCIRAHTIDGHHLEGWQLSEHFP